MELMTWNEERAMINKMNESNPESFFKEAYYKRIEELSNREGSVLYTEKHLAMEAGITPEKFLDDICKLALNDGTVGEISFKFTVFPKDFAMWLVDTQIDRKKQDETLKKGEEYSIYSFGNYVADIDLAETTEYNAYERAVGESDDQVNDVITKKLYELCSLFPDYETWNIIQELKEEKLLLFVNKEEDNSEKFFVNFLALSSGNWESELILEEQVSRTFQNCVWGKREFPEDKFEKLFSQTSIGQLLSQQGYTFTDLIQQDLISSSDPDEHFFTKKSPFLDSLRNELLKAGANGGVLTLCKNITIEDLTKAFKNPEGQIVFNEKAMVGIFHPQHGSDGGMEIILEKPFVLPVKNSISMTGNFYGITPNDFYCIGNLENKLKTLKERISGLDMSSPEPLIQNKAVNILPPLQKEEGVKIQKIKTF